MNVLVIAAHPDDEVFTVGGTLAMLAEQGHDIHVAIMTSYSAAHEAEQEKVFDILGINHLHNFDYGDTELDDETQSELIDVIARLMQRTLPDLIFTHHVNDPHTDHSSLARATLIATRDYGGTVAMYQATPNTKDFKPNWYIPLSEVGAAKKTKAVMEYSIEYQGRPYFRSVSGVHALDDFRGLEIGVEYAEAFEIVCKVGL